MIGLLKINGKETDLKCRFANNPWKKLRGLMFEDEKNFNYALIFEFPRETKIGSSLHMIFVFFPVKAVFLNKEKKVIDIVKMDPFNPNYTPKKAAKYVVEMPIKKANKIKEGDKIEW